MDQKSLFDQEAATAERDAAIDQVGESNWKTKFIDAIKDTAIHLQTFTTDDVLKRHPDLEKCGEKRVMGAAVRQLSKDKVIEPTGAYVGSDRRQSHARPKRQWRFVKVGG